MSVHCGYIIQVKDLRPHPNADRLQLLHVFETDTCVGLDVKVGDIGMYVPADIKLGERFCQVNGLLRQKDENGNPIGNGYLDPQKRNVKAINLRGQRSDGIYLPITSLMDFCKISDLKVGDQITILNGETICEKYIPRVNPARAGSVPHLKGVKKNICPLFAEHVDTEQLAYNLDKFHTGDIVQLTLKMHGTSQRTGNLPVIHERKQNFIQKLFHRPAKTYAEYENITGTRRVVLAGERKGGFYESDDFRHAMAAKFDGKLPRGITVYYEVVGFQGPNGAPIMGQVANSKIKDKAFAQQYGEVTTFSYGCVQDHGYEANEPLDTGVYHPCCELYVYRITMTNEDGFVMEFSPDQIKLCCEQWGVNVVPEFERFIIPDGVNPGEYVVRKVEEYYDGPDPIGKAHVREGVVARICNRSNFAVYKHKNFSFKVLEGIAKDEAAAPDMEEAQEIAEEDINE